MPNNMNPTQKELILAYVDMNGSILPAKMAGQLFGGIMFGSETSKRCRELRKEGKLLSESYGKFEKFYKEKNPQEASLLRKVGKAVFINGVMHIVK